MKTNQPRSLPHTIFCARLVASIGIVIALLIFGMVFMKTLTVHNQNIQRLHQNDLMTQAFTRVQEQMENTDYAQLSVLISRHTQRMLYLYDSSTWYNRYEMQLTLEDDLYRLTDAYRFVKSAYLYLPQMERCISNSRPMQPVPNWLQEYTQTTAEGILFDDGQLRNVHRRYSASGEELEALLVLTLDTAEIIDELTYIQKDQLESITVCWTADNQYWQLSDGKAYTPDEEESLIQCAPLHLAVLFHVSNADANRMLGQFYLMLWLFVGLILLYEGIILWRWYRTIYRPLQMLLVEAFGKAEEGDLRYRIAVPDNAPFYAVYSNYNRMMERMETYVENELKQKLLVSRANLKQLQAQINPHFMYNSYYVLYRLLKKGDLENAVLLAEHLGKFYQYITRNADDEKRLYEEVAHARVYAAIQQYRFRENLTYDIPDPPQAIAQVYVPRLILQPILENAFKYAYETGDETGAMRLRIRYVVCADGFDILIENSGKMEEETLQNIRRILQTDSAESETTALVNIQRRLSIYYGETSGLRVDRSTLGGLRVCMHICQESEAFNG